MQSSTHATTTHTLTCYIIITHTINTHKWAQAHTSLPLTCTTGAISSKDCLLTWNWEDSVWLAESVILFTTCHMTWGTTDSGPSRQALHLRHICCSFFFCCFCRAPCAKGTWERSRDSVTKPCSHKEHTKLWRKRLALWEWVTPRHHLATTIKNWVSIHHYTNNRGKALTHDT